MKRKLPGVLFLACVIVIVCATMISAAADIPAGVKDYYNYNQTDKSIVKVKKRLQQLGYFRADAQFSNVVSDELKKAVISFQQQNNVTADGVIDRDLLDLLFSDMAVKKGSVPRLIISNETGNQITESEIVLVPTETNEADDSKGKAKTGKAGHAAWVAIGFGAVLFFVPVIFVKKKRSQRAVPVKRYAVLQADKTVQPAGNPENKVRDQRILKKSSDCYPGITNSQNETVSLGKNDARTILNQMRYGHPENEARIHEIQTRKAEHYRQNQKYAYLNKQQEALLAKELRRQQSARKQESLIEKEQRKKDEYHLVEIYSEPYHQLNEMLTKYNIRTGFRSTFRLSYVFHSKRSFQELRVIEALAFLAEDNTDLKAAFEMVKSNRQKISQFKRENTVIKRSSADAVRNSGLSEGRFYQIEEELCRRLQNKAVTDLIINLDLYYRSVGGNQHDSRMYELGYDDLEKAFSMPRVPEIEYISIREERAKMNPKLRYSIMKRDEFRCVLCGARAIDGAILHVDHIIPVSKGGKTVASNLRTLCDQCNFGKGASYDPDGPN